MADNVNITPGSGAVAATDDIGGVQYQRVKINVGADGSANDVTPPAGDAVAGSTLVPVANLIYNGSGWDRARSISAGDAASTGIPALGNYVYNGTTWDRARGDVSNGLDVDVTRVQGTVTVDSELAAAAALADAAANPTTASVGALNVVYNGTTWDRQRSASGDALAATGIPAAGNLVYNGTTWDRVRGDTTNGLDVDVTRVQGTVTVDSELPAAASLTDATANPSTTTVGTAGLLYNGTTWDRQRSATAAGDASAATGMGAGVAYLYNGSTFDRQRSVAGAGDTTNVGVQASGKYLFNGTNWDRERNNIEGVALASSARTSTTASSEIINYNGRGLLVIFVVASAPSGGTLTLQVRGRTGVPTTWVQYAGAAVSGTGTYVYELRPGSGVAADGVTGRSSGSVPRRFDINVVHSNSNSTTYSVEYQLLV